jgi:hypothetical protein
VDVVDRAVERTDGGNRVGAHPEQVAGIEVRPDGVTDGGP